MDAQSSSSLAPDGSFRGFLERSLEAIAAEMPAAYDALCATLGCRRVVLGIDAERVGIRCDGRRLAVGDPDPGATVEFRSSPHTLRGLTSGRLSFLDAALDDRLLLRGAVDEIVVFYDGLLAYLRGAVRSPSLPGLLDAFAGRPGGAHHGERLHV